MNTPPSFRLKAAAVAVALCFVSPVVLANPTGGVVVSGSATMTSSGNTLSITNTPGAVLNWQQFNIDKGQTTQFVQQSAQSTVLNRVVGNNPSQILGTLRSNGQVFLINPFGIMFGVGSVVDVNGLIASTLNISNADFLLGRLNFAGSNGTSVLNQGSITTPLGGRVYLIGNNVTNQGVITSPQGKVLLAAGNQVSLVDSTTPHISVTLSAPAGGQAVNLGSVSAQGGSIDVYAPLIQQQGVLRADSATVDPQGNIVLYATQNATLAQGSITSASGAQGGNVTVQSAGATTVAGQVSALGNAGVGGNVKILGDQVTLTSSAQIDASGATGGGTALVGGDFQGKNAAVQNARITSVAKGATIKVDALLKGNAGQSVVWANDRTTFSANIFARGGAQGGNGGSVEVSGKQSLVFNGLVNTLAPVGKAGSFLMDPIGLCVVNDPAALNCSSIVAPSAVVNNVLTNGTHTLSTSGNDLIVVDPITIPVGTGGLSNNLGKSLILIANGGNVLTLNKTDAFNRASTALGGVIITNGASLTMTAIGSAASGTGEVHVGNSISTNGGAFTINAQSLASVDGGGQPFALPNGSFPAGVYTAGGNVAINATDFVLGANQTVPGVVNPADINTVVSGATTLAPVGGSVTIKSIGGNVATGVTIGVGSSLLTGTGRIGLTGYTYTNQNSLNAGRTTYSIVSTAQASFGFDHITNSFLDASVGAVLVEAYTLPTAAIQSDVFLGLSSTDSRCATSLCFTPSAVNHIWAPKGLAIGSLGSINVASNVLLEGGQSQYALVAVSDIILNGGITMRLPAVTAIDPATQLPVTFPQTSLVMIAGNNVINNVGGGALTVPAGHTWSLFAKDQTTSSLNGLAANILNLGQNPQTFSSALASGALSSLSAGNFSFIQLLGGLLNGATVVPGGQNNLAMFWGGAVPSMTWNTIPTGGAQTIAENNCALNPLLCGATTNSTVQANTQSTTNTATALNSTTVAAADLTYSASLGVNGGVVWISYDDVRRSRQATRRDEDELDVARRVGGAGVRGVELKAIAVDVKRAEGRVRETEMELRAAEAELRAANTPEERVHAEVRQSVAAFRRADAEVQKANAETRHAEAEIKSAQTPDAKAAAESRHAEAQGRLARAEVRKAEVEVESAQLESKRAGDTPAAADKRAEVEVKQANLEVKRAQAEVKTAKDPAARGAAEEKVSVALAKQAGVEARKATAEAQRAEEDAKSSGSPAAQRFAADKKIDAEVKQSRAELREAEVAVKTAKDPVARADAEVRAAQAALKKSEAEVKQAAASEDKHGSEAAKANTATKKAQLEERKAEVALKVERDEGKKAEVAVRLADARVKTAEAEEKQAVQEGKEARDNVKTVRSEANKAVLLRKAESSEARGTAKAMEVEARKADVEVKRAESEVKQAEAAVKGAKSPQQRAEAEKRLSEKREALDGKREMADRKHDASDKAADVADEKEQAYHTTRSRRDERVVEAFGGVDLSGGGRKRSQELLEMRHEFMKEKFGGALKVLTDNPRAADVKKCEGGAAAGCIPTQNARTNAAGEIMARVQLPLLAPTQAFLPAIQRKIAVVIGINAYQDPDIPALNGAVRDADAVATMLKEKLGYDVRVVHNGTRADIVRTLNEVADETGSKDSVVVYYAGHGYEMEDTKEGYWIPSDASTSNPDNWISNADINQLLTNIPAKQMLVVSDSCFSGALTNEQKVSSRVTSVETPAEILGKRSVVVMSSGGEEPVMDEGRDGHSVFAWHLMDKVQKLDSFEHGAEVFDSIRAGVAADGVPQLPEYGASVSAGHAKGGEYLFEVRKY